MAKNMTKKSNNTMTKAQVKAKINKLFKEYKHKLMLDIENVLVESDMWYGLVCSTDDRTNIINKKNTDDRNADQLVADGEFDSYDEIGLCLHTRKELGL